MTTTSLWGVEGGIEALEDHIQSASPSFRMLSFSTDRLPMATYVYLVQLPRTKWTFGSFVVKVKGDIKRRRQLSRNSRKCASNSICRLWMVVLFMYVTQQNRCFHYKLELVRAQPYLGSALYQ